MSVEPRFLRTPNRTNSQITDSYCAFCQTFVGASPRPALLRLMEDAHACGGMMKEKSGGLAERSKSKGLRPKKL